MLLPCCNRTQKNWNTHFGFSEFQNAHRRQIAPTLFHRNSQQGNNNPYCHDTPLSWVNWENRDRYPDVIDFCRHMIRLRREHPVLRRPGDHTAENSSGYPELSFHGEHAWQLNMWEPFLTFGFMYAEPAADFGTEEDCFVYCGVNAHWEAHRMELPRLPEGMYWHLYADSSGVQDRAREIEEGSIQLGPRSLTVLLGK
jgi:glycogen operon protein